VALNQPRGARTGTFVLTKALREGAYWRDLLKRIARNMEQAARMETDPKRQRLARSPRG
jgi:hypothetical protein